MLYHNIDLCMHVVPSEALLYACLRSTGPAVDDNVFFTRAFLRVQFH